MIKYISSSDKKILLELFTERNLIYIYYFHEKYLFSPAQMNRFVRNYLEEKIISFDDYKIKLTEHGIKWIVHNREKIFLYPNKKEWKKIPKEWLVKINENIDDLELKNI
jgi:polyhydroxyalkanoate synthesis regulator protein